MNRIILFSGKAGTGKSTCAKHLLYLVQKSGKVDADIFSFAEGVKDVAVHSFGWTGTKDKRGRELLQGIGKTGRAYHADIWVKQMYEKYSRGIEKYTRPIWGIVDDWRFPNEYYFLDDVGELVTTIRIVDPAHEILAGTPAYDDESETALDNFEYYNYVIRNAPDVEALKLEVEKIYERILED